MIMFAVGGSTLMSIRLGENDMNGAKLLLGNTMSLVLISSAFITVFGFFFAEPLLNFFGATPENMPFALSYMKIIFLGNIFMMITMGMNNFLRAEGKPTIAMATMLIGAIGNIILDYLLIVVFGLGVEGAAWATVLARVLSSLWTMYFYFGKKTIVPLQIAYMKLKLKVFWEIVVLGSSSAIQQLSMSFMVAILNTLLIKVGGDNAITAMATTFSIMTLIHLPIMGIAQGSQPILGYNLGAKKFHRVKEALVKASVAAFGIGIIGLLVIQIFPESLALMFLSDKALVDISVNAIRIFLMLVPIVGLQIVWIGYFRSVGKGWHALGFGLLRQIALLLPIAHLLAKLYGLNGIWLSAPISDLLSTIVVGIFIIVELRKMAPYSRTVPSDT
ncbi:MAG TPA: MATE family efflux transporter [Caldisericia bacterium]|nr:MATE family efflux transporter [Caldisericia bacterium]